MSKDIKCILPIEKITIDRDRFGERKKNLEAMAESLSKYGQLQPIVLSIEDNRLIAGWRRLAGAVMLGWEEVWVTYREEEDDFARKTLELEENVQRLDMSWAERNEAIATLHKLRGEADPEWNASKTAELLGYDKGHVSKVLTVAKEIEKDPTLKEANTLTGALERIKKKNDLERRELVVKLKKQQNPELVELAAEIFNGDALEHVRTLEDESINAVVTDPPYGIDFDLVSLGEVFNDEEEQADAVVQNILPELFRVLTPNSWLVMFYDLDKLFLSKPTRKLMEWAQAHGAPASLVERAGGLKHWIEKAGFSYVGAVPCIWGKPDRNWGRTSPRTNLVHAYEGFILACKGDGHLHTGKRPNLFLHEVHGNEDRTHAIQKPTPLMRAIVEMITVPGELVYDPFCGGGSTGLGALACGREFLGCELNEKFAHDANVVLQERRLQHAAGE